MTAPDVPGFDSFEEVGRGGYSVVYRARQIAVDRTVAVKVMARMDVDDDVITRFEQECRAMAALSWHPNVVVLYDAGTTPAGTPYLAMEYLPGGSLADRITRDGPAGPATTVTVGVQLASVLAAAHEVGVLHRDIKPENVLVDRFGQAKLADFGVASIRAAQRTATGVLSGTLAHLAPEILEGGRSSVASDVYALGSTLYTVLAGRPAFVEPTDENQLAIIRRVLDRPVPDLRTTGTPDSLATVIERAMAKDPADRQPSADVLGAELEAAASGTGAAVPSSRPANPPSPTDGRGQAVTDELVVPSPAPPTSILARPGRADAPPPRRPAPPPAPPSERSDAPPGVGAVSGPTTDRADRGPSGRSRRGAVVAAVAIAIAVVGGAAAMIATRSNDTDDRAAADTGDRTTTTSDPLRATTPDTLPARPAAVTHTISVGDGPDTLAVGTGGEVWVTNTWDDTVSRLDPTTRTVTTVQPAGESPYDLAFGDGALWIAGRPAKGRPAMTKVVPGRGIDATIPLGQDLGGVAFGEGSVWATDPQRGVVYRIDPETEEVVDTILLARQSSPGRIAVGFGSLWVTDRNLGSVIRIDPDTGKGLGRIEVGDLPIGIALGQGSVWVVNSGEDTVSRIDPDRGEVVATIRVGRAPERIALGAGSVWVSNYDDDSVSRIAPGRNRVVQVVRVGDGPLGLAVSKGSVWVANDRHGSVTRIGT